MENEGSNFVGHSPCPACPSSDGFAVYDDGHGYCFVCGHYEGTTEPATKVQKVNHDLIQNGKHKALEKRQLSLQTVKKWDYQVGKFKDKTVQIANYKDDTGTTIAQKIRFPNKDFLFIGDTKNVGLYGQWRFGDGGKRIVVTEGEIDCLSVSQTLGDWPVVSVPNGAQAAKKAIQKELEWLCKFDSVVFMFVNDEAGVKAAKECATLFPAGKAKIANLPMKDANEMLVSGLTKELSKAMYEAKSHRPDGILNGKDLWDVVTKEEDTASFNYPYSGLNEKTLGIRKGEIVTVTAGSGIGKSQLCREFAHFLLQQGETIGYIALEESVKRTSLGLMSIAINKPLHFGSASVTEAELKEAFDNTLGTGRVFLYDHWGSTDSDNLMDKVRYLANGCGCGWIILDHISIVVSGLEGGDERRIIDNTMTKLRALVEEVKVGLILVSHLKRPEGRGHEEGARTTLAQLRGSAGIAQLSDVVLGCERDQQDTQNPNVTLVRVLKNRWTGETGAACLLEYDKETGRMTEWASEDEEALFETKEDEF